MSSPAAYKRKRWERLRARKLQTDPWCECDQCKALGHWTPAEVVDHIQPVNQGGPMWAWENLRSMSWRCHSRKTLHEDVLGRPARVKGVDPDTGMPLDPRHPWRQ